MKTWINKLSSKLSSRSKKSSSQEMILAITATLILVVTTAYNENVLLEAVYDTMIGRIVLLLLIIGVIIKDIYAGIVLMIIVGILYFYKNKDTPAIRNLFSTKEGFTWSDQEKSDFTNLIKTLNPSNSYDLDVLQKYVSKDELNYFMENNIWPWSTETQNRYKNALDINPYVRIYKDDGLNSAQKIYNEYAINYILDNQEKVIECKKQNDNDSTSTNTNTTNRLPSGWGNFGYTSGLIS